MNSQKNTNQYLFLKITFHSHLPVNVISWIQAEAGRQSRDVFRWTWTISRQQSGRQCQKHLTLICHRLIIDRKGMQPIGQMHEDFSQTFFFGFKKNIAQTYHAIYCNLQPFLVLHVKYGGRSLICIGYISQIKRCPDCF